MKKSKLSFFIVSALLAITSLAGCNNTATNSDSKAGDNSSITNSDSSQGGETNSSDNSQGASSSGGASNSSQGGNSNSSQGGTSQNSSSSSDGGQGSQTDKTDWTKDEKAIMSNNLHGLVLPFVAMDVEVKYEERQKAVIIQSSANMVSGFLNSYVQKYLEEDSGWIGGDISYEYESANGCVFEFVKPVTQNGQKYYVSVMFGGGELDATGRTTFTPTGKFYLQAMDPFIYEYPTEFISGWLQQQYGTTINPPALRAEFYNLDEEGVLYAYSETNLEDAYKQALLATEQFTIDAEKDVLDFYVAHPTDRSYVLKFKYDSDIKMMIIKVEAPKGWNAAKINEIFRKYNVTPFALPVIEDSNITFEVSDQTYNGVAWVTINAGKVTAQMAQAYVNALKAMGYKVAYPTVDPEDPYYITTVNVFTDDGMYTLYLNYYKDVTPYPFTISFQLVANPDVVKSWPAEQIARYVTSEKDTVPAFADTCYGYSFSNKDGLCTVVVHVDEGSEADAQAAYIATLTGAGYVSDGTLKGQPRYKSRNGEIHVSVACDTNQIPGEIDILIQNISASETPWPSADIANLLIKIGGGETITDTIPVLDVSNAKECYVSDTYSEIRIEGIGDDFAATAKQALLDANFVENPYYYIDFNMTGALISPNKQFVVHIYVVNNDVMLMIKGYWAPEFKVVGLGGNWKYDESLVFFSDATKQDEVDQGWYVSQLKAEFDVNANDEFKVTDGGEWFGYSVLEANEKFSEGTSGNIKANEKGHVVLYLKSLTNGNKGIVIEFTPDEPELSPWPEQEILTFFGEDTFAVIPEIKIADASYEVVDKFDEDGVKCISIMVTVTEAPSKMATAIQELENQFSYSYDNELEGYVSSNEGFPVYSFTANDDNSFFVSIAYFAPAEEPDFKVVGLDNNWNYEDGHEFEEVDDIPEGYLAQYTALFHVDLGDEFKVTNGTLWLGADELVANDKFGTNGDKNIIAKESGEVALTFSILDNGEKQISIIFTADDEQPTEVTYTITYTGNWDEIMADDPVFYAYVWGGDYAEPQWIRLDVDEENHCFYLNDVSVTAEHFIVVRMNPACEEEENEPGWSFKWNQTDDLNFPSIGLRCSFANFKSGN